LATSIAFLLFDQTSSTSTSSTSTSSTFLDYIALLPEQPSLNSSSNRTLNQVVPVLLVLLAHLTFTSAAYDELSRELPTVNLVFISSVQIILGNVLLPVSTAAVIGTIVARFLLFIKVLSDILLASFLVVTTAVRLAWIALKFHALLATTLRAAPEYSA